MGYRSGRLTDSRSFMHVCERGQRGSEQRRGVLVIRGLIRRCMHCAYVAILKHYFNVSGRQIRRHIIETLIHAGL